MNQRYKWFAAAIAGLAVTVPVIASAATCDLELKRLESEMRGERPVYTPETALYRATSYQSFYMQIGREQPDNSGFSRAIEKEPDEYASPNPFRGVAKLGSQEYGFVLDAKPSESEDEESEDQGTEEEASDEQASPPRPKRVEGYSRLFFDLNHNGDLTDDGVIEAASESQSSSSTYVRSYFSRVDVTVDAGGTELDYAFFLSVYARSSTSYQYASASLRSAVYRQGEITLDGTTRRIVVLDFNGNGRFDDQFAVRDDVNTPDGQIYPTYGDMLLVDPDPNAQGYRSSYDPTTSDYQHYVSKLVNIDGKFYDFEISPAGDKLTLTPSSVPLGKITNPNDGFRAIVYGEKGFVKICGGKSDPVALPAGTWKLLSYTIDQTGYEEKAEEKEEEKQPSLLEMLSKAIVGATASRSSSRPRFTLVSARATKDCPSVEVGEGQTVAMPFGPPYKPEVQVAYRSSGDQVQLGLNIVGSAGERCSSLYVNGNRPGKPEFTIVDPEDQEVAQGNFEYG